MNLILFCGSFLGFFSLCMGTYFDHVLKLTLNPGAQHMLGTALRYHQWHALLIVAIGLSLFMPLTRNIKIRLSISGWIIITGTLLFCFSLYLSAVTGLTWITYLTPIGGITLMAGWISLLWLSLLPVRHA